MKKAVIYARYSSDKQTEQSIEGQLHVCTDYAKRNDIKIVGTYIDRAMSGTNDHSTEFQKMLKDSSKHEWEIVLVYKLDRFSRNKYEMAMHKKTLRDNGVKLLSAMENIPDTPEGIILESLLEGMAEYYSAELSQKVKRGKRESRTKGLFTGGYVPFGYKVENKKILINKEQAEIVNYMYEQYSKGMFVRDIITELDNLGITNNTKKPFTKTVVHRILTDEKYIGIYRFKGEIFTNLYPQIVPNKLYEIVQTKNKDNVHGGRKTDANYILSKKIKCGYCGNNINANTGTSKTGKVYRYYSCTGVTVKKTCNKKNVRKDELEELVMNAIYKAFDNPITITTLAEDIVTRHK